MWQNIVVGAALLASSVVGAAQSGAQLALPQQAAVASAHPKATEAGHRVLAQGGNACDAAVAVTAALAVVEPYGSGLGGGGFYLTRTAEGKAKMLDARETAPADASADMYLDSHGDVVPRLSIDGPLAAGIPGIPAALDELSSRCGQLSLADSLAPAIELAEQGFAFDQKIVDMLGFRQQAIAASPAASEIFFNNGELPKVGEVLVQRDLAAVLKRIAERGREGFYAGDTAEALVEGVQRAGGIWQLKDLDNYRPQWREPVVGEYRGMSVTAAGLPSSGGIVLLQMLNILRQFPEDSLEMDRPLALHLQVEAMRRAYRDRAEYLGDADFVDVPRERLLSPHYAAGLAASIRSDRATPSESLPGIVQAAGGEDTTHFSIVDRQGNAVAATLSINYPFGSGFVPPGTGVLLNDEMDDFSSKPGVANVYGLVGSRANAIAPNKRMLSSMTPTFIEKDNKLLALGSPGGSRIITMVLRGALDFYRGRTLNDIVSAPRIHHQFLPDVVQFEPEALSRNQQLELQLMGHELKEMGRQYGNMQAVLWDMASGEVEAASDPRGLGRADLGSYGENTASQ
ncbi:gamma-glutamyltransferase [gamma proteobacterium HTCC5015]|nr:gamma-glutamyltransferase [gamma proteobacterium HTCC5015]